MAKNNNTGANNSGNLNSGYRNSGSYNSGSYNSGNRNSGELNSGSYNSDNRNSGYRNSGSYNSGDLNSGNLNSGNFNSGDFNSGNWNSGAFNRDEPKMRLFEKELDMTVSEFYGKYNIRMDIPLNRWVDESDMTEEEKKTVKGWETTGGYLKTLPFKEACRQWWAENPNEHERFLTLPGFDAQIFKDITGIDVEVKSEPETINIGGKNYVVTDELKAALKNLKEV